MKAKLDNLMALLSERTADRHSLAVRWIVEIMAAVFVDEMRMLYVGASTIARDANVSRYDEFVALSKQHIEDFNNQLIRYIGDLEVSFISEIRAIERCHLWIFNRLKSGPCSSVEGGKLFKEMRLTAEQMHKLCSTAQISGYAITSEMIAEIGEQVWCSAGRPPAQGHSTRSFE